MQNNCICILLNCQIIWSQFLVPVVYIVDQIYISLIVHDVALTQRNSIPHSSQPPAGSLSLDLAIQSYVF